MVSTAILRDENLWTSGADTSTVVKAFTVIGDRGKDGHSSTVGIDRQNVMFYTLVSQDAVGCWDTSKPYARKNLAKIIQNATTLYFPNDLKVDRGVEQSVWVISNRLPTYLYAELNYDDVNFRIQRANVHEAIQGTVCDPNVLGTNEVDTGIEGCY